jgi:hypothetical protein
VNIHDEPVRGRPVRDSVGSRLGRIVAIDDAATDYAATGTSGAWYLPRVIGWRRGFGPVPAASARRGKRRSVQLTCARSIQVRSPQLSRQRCRLDVNRRELNRRELHASYAPAGRV